MTTTRRASPTGDGVSDILTPSAGADSVILELTIYDGVIGVWSLRRSTPSPRN